MSQLPPPPQIATSPHAYMPGLPPNRGGGILALGICSIVFGGACGIGLVLGIIGLKMAGKDLDDMARGRKDRNGEGLVQAGRICSIIGVCLGSLGAAVALLYVATIALTIIGAVAGAAGAP